MATNVVSLNVYQINQGPPIPLADVTQIAFPTGTCILRDCFDSPTRALSTGISVYSAVQIPSGDLYYSEKTIAQLVTLWNA